MIFEELMKVIIKHQVYTIRLQIVSSKDVVNCVLEDFKTNTKNYDILNKYNDLKVFCIQPTSNYDDLDYYIVLQR